MARALQELEDRAETSESQAREERGRAATREWWRTPASRSTRAWVTTGGASATATQANQPPPTFLTPVPPRNPQRHPSTFSTAPQLSRGSSSPMDTTVFSVAAEDLTRGIGLHNHLLEEDYLKHEVLELMEEDKVPEGHGQDGPKEGH